MRSPRPALDVYDGMQLLWPWVQQRASRFVGLPLDHVREFVALDEQTVLALRKRTGD